jgi:hypothetical protein
VSLKALISISAQNNIPANQLAENGGDFFDDAASMSSQDSSLLGGYHKKTSSTNAKIVRHIRGG